ncbi:MAG: M48 family metalloprotease [Elusimicrobiota bacterium]|nr:M48 family metalloprotease [Elusimicrobiota bacterium]
MKKPVSALCVLALVLQSAVQAAPAFAQFQARAASAGAPAVLGAVAASGVVGAHVPISLTPSPLSRGLSLAGLHPLTSAPDVRAAGNPLGATASMPPAAPVAVGLAVRTVRTAAVPGTQTSLAGRDTLAVAASALGLEGSRISPDSQASSARTFFDGSQRYADARLPEGPAHREGSSSERSSAARLLPASELEAVRRASGLAPPSFRGTKPLEDYRQPQSVRAKQAAYRAFTSVLAPISFILPFVGLGLVGGGILAAVSVSVWMAWDLGPGSLPESGPTLSARPDLRTARRVRRVVRVLVRRLGLPPERAPRRIVHVDEPLHAGVSGESLGPEAIMIVGAEYGKLPVRVVAAVMAHELGHLVHGDLRGLFNRLLHTSGIKILPGYAAVFFFMALFELLLGTASGLFTAISIYPVLLAPALFVLALASSYAFRRQAETRADHFSAWLTDPVWLAGFFSLSARVRRGLRAPLADAFSAHPATIERIKRLLRRR